MNSELREMYKADQQDRTDLSKKKITWDLVTPRDISRRKRVMEMYNKKDIITGRDFYNAALIFQHGQETQDYEFALELCKHALKKRNRKAKWLYAAIFDRILTSKKAKYQKYGTQFKKDSPSEPWYLYPVDPNTTDEERAEFCIRPLAEQIKRVEEMNANENN